MHCFAKKAMPGIDRSYNILVTRRYFNVHSKADIRHKSARNEKLKSGGKEEIKVKKRMFSEVSVAVRGIRGVNPEEEKEGYGGKELQKRKVLGLG